MDLDFRESDAWEHGEFLVFFEEMEMLCKELVELLMDPSSHHKLEHPEHRLEYVKSLNSLAEKFRRERENFGLWREDERDFDEIRQDLINELVKVGRRFHPELTEEVLNSQE